MGGVFTGRGLWTVILKESTLESPPVSVTLTVMSENPAFCAAPHHTYLFPVM